MRLFKNTDRENYLKLGLAAACCLVIGFLYVAKPLSTPQVDQFIQATGYYFCALVAFCLIFFLFRAFFRQADRRPTLKRGIIVFLGILPIGVFVHLHEPHRFKVLNDEYAISSLAQQMHLERKAAVPGQSHQIGHNLYFMSHYADKRSQFFPFLVSLAHDLTGYRPNNVFWVNGLLTMGLLCLIYASVQRITNSRILGYWACLFLASVPLFSQVATSAGYDLANVFLVWLAICIGLRFTENPSERTMNALVACGVALAYVRYESVLYLIPVVLLVGHWWWREGAIRMTFFTSISPLLLTIPVLLNLHMSGNEAFQHLNEREPCASFFAAEYIIPNLKIALSYFFTPSFHTTASVFCSFVGLIGLIFVAVIFFSRGLRKQGGYELVGGYLCAFVVVCFLVFIAHFWGQLDDYQAVRFALPLYAASAFGSALFLREALNQRLWPWLLVLQAGYMLLLTPPAVANHVTTKEMIGSYFQEWVVETVKNEQEAKVLLVMKSNLSAGLYGLSAMPLGVVSNDPRIPKYFAIDYGYDEVWVARIERFDATGKRWENVDAFGPIADWMILEPIHEKELYHDLRGRISRLRLEE